MFRDWTMLCILGLSNVGGHNSVDCKIDDSGAEFVGGLRWPNLRFLSMGTLYFVVDLVNNKITALGVRLVLRQ